MKTFTPVLLLAAALFATGCQGGAATSNSTANKPAANAPQNTEQSKPAASNVVNDHANASNKDSGPGQVKADTPTAAYKAAYAARKNKDIKTLKTLISKEMTEFFEILAEGKKGDEAVEAALKDIVEKPQGDSDEVRDEKITGNTATLQYKDAKGEWRTADFVKEDGIWKMTIAKDEMKKDK